MANCSKHAILRLQKRMRVNEKSSNRMVEIALNRGKRADDYKALEKYYLQDISRDDCYAITYNNFLFVMSSGNVCVTVYHLPSWFGKTSKKILKNNNIKRSFYAN